MVVEADTVKAQVLLVQGEEGLPVGPAAIRTGTAQVGPVDLVEMASMGLAEPQERMAAPEAQAEQEESLKAVPCSARRRP